MIEQSVIDEVVSQLARAPEFVVGLVKDVPVSNLRRRPAEGRWSVHEHACHLAVVHNMINERLDRFESEERPVFVPYLPGQDEDDDVLLRMDLEESLVQYRKDRKALCKRLRETPREIWEKCADHGEYSHYSFSIMVRHLLMHDYFHAYRIEELLLKREWA